MNFTPYKQRCFLWLAVVNALFVSVCIGDGVYDESTTRYFTNFADQYSFSASAYPNWKITSASTSGVGVHLLTEIMEATVQPQLAIELQDSEVLRCSLLVCMAVLFRWDLENILQLTATL